MSFPKYPAYKDSGIEWIGEIPVGWDVLPLKRIFSLKNGATPKSGQSDFWDGEITWITPADLNSERPEIITHSKRTISVKGAESCAVSIVPKGSIIISTRAPIGSIGLAGTDLCTNQGCRSLVPDKGVSSKFFLYFFYSAVSELQILGKGTTFLELSSDNLASFLLCFPPLPEQQAIASFLDRECGKIDALIAEQQRLIALLAEKRQAVISHAVTKGLNPNAPMKDSGIPWIGMVPEGWEVVTAGRVVRVISGFAFPSDKFLKYGEGVPLLRGVNVGVGKLRWDDVVYWKRQIDDGLDIYELKEGDIVIGMDRPWISSGLRISKIYKKDLPCLLLQRVGLLRLKKYLNSSFLMYQYSLPNFMHFLAPEMTGVSVPHISPSQIASFPICLPSRKIQDEIVTYLARAITEFESLILTATNAITLLKERRAALISAAVTGKIDVRAQNKALAA
ncbi:restriction endonuclease subunit S [Acetobacter oryzifermentans]|uniref:restriction endonuclease subunit S n=1 Tax=Acetobacter oryzifermentans TaxID=1633874 RepID=UPI0007B0B3A6|nr:restriction endonuclease subunit S [Acetobacter oryzifermentans]